MSVLIIVTGISSSGKSTLAKKIKQDNKLTLLSLDNYKVNIYKKYGFNNDEERKVLKNMAICQMKADMFLIMRKKRSLIVEYPFDITWQSFFDYIIEKYNYKSVIINVNSRSFEDVWKSRAIRDSNFNDRERCLTAQTYIKDKKYISNNKINDKYKKIKYQEYVEGKYTSLKGNYVFNELNYYRELEKILSKTKL